jgi:phosphopentomutase
VVLDSAGVGEMPDADKFNDKGTNTIGHTIEHNGKNELFTLNDLGLENMISKELDKKSKLGSYGIMAESSHGKDTTTGHWEMAGAPVSSGFSTYTENGFPKEIMDEWKEKTGYDYLGNYSESGTVILDEFGEEHMKTKKLIVYTSADSVFQIAAHEDVIPIEELYRVCKVTREMLDKYNVARIIARPFIGNKKGEFKRTYNRHDYSMLPETDTMLDVLKSQDIPVIAVGKIGDIFAHQGTTEEISTKGNTDGLNKTMELLKKGQKGLIFVNLVDFDMLYGHRRDPKGYYEALKEVDSFTKDFMSEMTDDDLFIYVADHGCDPTYKGSDHTREYVPLMVYSPSFKENVTLGIRNSFADVSATILDNFNLLDKAECGESFLNKLR